MQKRKVINSPRLNQIRRKRRKSFIAKIVLMFLVIVLFILILSFVSKIKKINISEINVEGNKVVDTTDILKIANKNLIGKYFYLFPKSNFLFYPKNKIRKELLSSYQRIKEVSFDLDKFNKLNIYTTEYVGKYLWCGGMTPSINEDSSNKCYFLDKNGYAFDQAPYFSGEIYFKFYGNNFITGLQNDNVVGSYFLQDKFEKLVLLKNNMELIGLKPSAFYLDNNKDGNIFITKDPTGPKIVFKMDSDYEKVAENLQSAISTDPLKTDLKNNLNSLLYIDLRFGNKVYFKFSNKTLENKDLVKNNE